jgi:hypothetical protein
MYEIGYFARSTSSRERTLKASVRPPRYVISFMIRIRLSSDSG